MKKKAFLKWALFLPITLALLLGCAGKGVKTIEGDPETLYRQGLTRFNKRDYSEALKKFEQLKSSFPDSPPYTTWAELKVGDCHFFMKGYVEAIAAYQEFKKIHPTHEEMPYVQYQIGMAHFNQMLSHDRDQTFTQKGLSNFEYLVATYLFSLFTAKAKEKIEICKKQLAAHEFYVGNFYYKHENFKAASLRFQGLPEKFPKMDQEDKVLFLLGKSYLELDQGEKAREAFTQLIAEYPQSSHYGEAKTILQQNMNEKKVKESKKKGEVQEVEPEPLPLVKFEEERRQFLQFNAPLPATSQSIKPNPHPKAEIGLEMKFEEEKRMVVFPSLPNPSGEKEKPKEEASPDPGEAKLADTSQPIDITKEKPKEEASPDLGEAKLADTDQPIDITSDRVETYSKENLIIFRGNVIARQKDVVIYADSIEVVTVGDGKGIERVVASGNVKVQQGLRVANCQKAVFYNLERKIFLTGEPKVWEGENIISGDEIVFDLAQNRVVVKGGVGGRGKVKIHSGGEFEKKK